MAMPAAQIVVTKALAVWRDKGEVGTIVVGILEHVNKNLVVQFEADFGAIASSFGG